MLTRLSRLVLGSFLAVMSMAAADDLRISGPVTNENLSVFLVHRSAAASSKGHFLTLKEAMDGRQVAVFETGQVNELAAENLSATPVYIQSGDIVKGGQQDRVLTTDLILPAHSGKVPISAFCVEQGRWTKRGSESAAQFGLSDKAVAFKSLKSAVHDPNAQSKVWEEVAKAREDLAAAAPPTVGSGRGIGSGSGVGTGSGSGGGIGPGIAGPVSDRPAPSAGIVALASTSMEIAMESRTVTSATEAYRKSLEGIVAHQDDVVGFVYAVNGEINSAEVYASSDLFRRMWPKLLESAATEAVAARGTGAKSPQPKVVDAKGLLRDGDAAREVSRQSTGRLSVARKESARVLLFVTTDSQANGEWLHRSYLVK